MVCAFLAWVSASPDESYESYESSDSRWGASLARSCSNFLASRDHDRCQCKLCVISCMCRTRFAWAFAPSRLASRLLMHAPPLQHLHPLTTRERLAHVGAMLQVHETWGGLGATAAKDLLAALAAVSMRAPCGRACRAPAFVFGVPAWMQLSSARSRHSLSRPNLVFGHVQPMEDASGPRAPRGPVPARRMSGPAFLDVQCATTIQTPRAPSGRE